MDGVDEVLRGRMLNQSYCEAVSQARAVAVTRGDDSVKSADETGRVRALGPNGGSVFRWRFSCRAPWGIEVMSQNSGPSRVCGCVLMIWNSQPPAWSLTQRGADRGKERTDRTPLCCLDLLMKRTSET